MRSAVCVVDFVTHPPTPPHAPHAGCSNQRATNTPTGSGSPTGRVTSPHDTERLAAPNAGGLERQVDASEKGVLTPQLLHVVSEQTEYTPAVVLLHVTR